MPEQIFDPREYKKIVSEYRKMQAHFTDPLTGLPTLTSVFSELSNRLEREKRIGVISLRILEGDKLEPEYGFDIFDEWILKIAEILKDFVLRNFAPYENACLFVIEPRTDMFFIAFSGAKRDEKPLLKELEEIVSQEIPITCKVVYSSILFDPAQRVERILARNIERIQLEHLKEESRLEMRIKALFRMVLKRGEIRTVYQPIYHLNASKSVFAYEALARGPKDTELEVPGMLFSVADLMDELHKLEALCHWKALLGSKRLENDSKYLFLNTSGKLLQEKNSSFIRELLRFSEELNIEFQRIVVELTERYAITDFKTLRENLEFLKKQKIKISIDDVGVGYSSLRTLAELQPDFLKYDMVLVRDIHKDFAKQSLLEMIVQFGQKIGSPVIAEGVEKEEELEVVKKLGVFYAQGFLLSPPVEIEW